MRFFKVFITNILAFVLLLLINNNILAQKNSNIVDQRIIDVYGILYVKDLKINSPERISYLNFFLNNSYEIRDIPYDSDEKMIKVSEVSLNTKVIGNISRPAFDINNFNVLLYKFKRNRKIKTLFRIDNTNKVIVFHSEEEIAAAFNQSK